MYQDDSDGWHEYSRLVLAELKRLDGDIKQIDEQIKQISVDIAMLKVKSGLWGSAGAIISIVVYYLSKKFL